jgi:hypothetical protein
MRLFLRANGLDQAQARLSQVRVALRAAVQDALLASAQETAQALSEAAPRGRASSSGGGGTPIGSDAPGTLKDSFTTEIAEQSASVLRVVVRTTQPAKLRYVRYGRGPVLPVQKLALMWEGLEHPVRRAGPAPANDFVTPVLQAARDATITRVTDAVDVAISGG